MSDSAENSVSNTGQFKPGNPYRFKPGESGNPGGRPRKDLSAEIAEAIFAEHGEEIYKAMLAKLLKGDAKVFTALAERPWGKPKQALIGGDENDSPVKVLLIGAKS